MSRQLWLVVALAALGFLGGGCLKKEVECSAGLTRCGLDCVDLTSESGNCGACGIACGEAQTCVNSACQCREGSTACNGQCAVLASDPRNCGACGNACPSGQVCEAGACKVSCSVGSTVCGGACVNLQTDAGHCGACGTACTDSRSCHAGVCTYDVVAACFNSGQVVGLQAGADVVKGPNVSVGTNIQTVAPVQDVLLALEGISKKLRETTLSDYSALPEAVDVGASANQVLVADPYVYVLNSGDNTLVAYQRTKDPGTSSGGTHFPNGLGLKVTGSVNFGENTNPFAMVKVGDALFVTLYGNLQGSVSAGGKLARVNLSDPARPVIQGTFLQLPTGADLRAFSGSNPEPLPAGITTSNSSLYITLNNLDPKTFGPGGPGLLVKVDPQAMAVDRTLLLSRTDCPSTGCTPEGVDCLNPGWVAPVGGQLVVSCGGKSTYDASFNLVAVDKAALVLLGADNTVLDVAPLACPAGASGCVPPSAGRFAVVGSRVFVGDNDAGRVFVYDVSGGKFTEVKGLSTGTAITACPASGASLVGDVVAIP